MSTFKKTVGQILLSALKVKNEFKTSLLKREFSTHQPVEQVSARPWRKCFVNNEQDYHRKRGEYLKGITFESLYTKLIWKGEGGCRHLRGE